DGGDRRKSVLRSKERDALKRKIEQRPSKQKLVTQHILLTASNADPSIQRKAEELKRCKLKDDLNKNCSIDLVHSSLSPRKFYKPMRSWSKQYK
ncbi:hypothetical protein WUBG_04800, partial [Wuchereria bancrofti]